MSTNCQKIRPLFDRYLDGELGRKERSLVSEHLQNCSSCREALQRETDVIAMFDLLPEMECPEHVLENIRDTVRSSRKTSLLSRIVVPLVQTLRRPLVPVAAAAAIIAFLIFRSSPFETEPNGRTDLAATAYSTEELQRARASAKWTLAFTAKQLNDAEAQATRAVLLDYIPRTMKKSITSSLRELPGGTV